MLGIASCSKNANEKVELNEEEQFIETPNGLVVKYSEEDDFIISKSISRKLGYEEIVISGGDYQILVNDNNFGTTQLNVKHSKKLKTAGFTRSFQNNSTLSEGGIGIRIAKVKKRKCGGEYVDCTCCCGIGFNCGFTTGFADDQELEEMMYSNSEQNPINSETFDPRVKRAILSLNENEKTLTIKFIEKVNWRSLN